MKLWADIFTLVGAVLLAIIGIVYFTGAPAIEWLNGVTSIVLGIGLILLSTTGFIKKKA